MKKIVVVSDTHGNCRAIDKLLPIMNESDYVFHLGDYHRDIVAYRNDIKAEVVSVNGNCDGGGEDTVLDIDGVRVMLTHGDRYGVKGTLLKLFMRAKEVGANVVFYGHTHDADIVEQEGVYLINPGCTTMFSQNSYCYVVIYDGKITAKIVNF